MEKLLKVYEFFLWIDRKLYEFFKWLLFGSFKVSKNYAVDWLLFHKFRNFSDGITLAEFSLNTDLYEGDHNPKTSFRIAILNVYLIQIEVYNVNHVE